MPRVNSNQNWQQGRCVLGCDRLIACNYIHDRRVGCNSLQNKKTGSKLNKKMCRINVE